MFAARRRCSVLWGCNVPYLLCPADNQTPEQPSAARTRFVFRLAVSPPLQVPIVVQRGVDHKTLAKPCMHPQATFGAETYQASRKLLKVTLSNLFTSNRIVAQSVYCLNFLVSLLLCTQQLVHIWNISELSSFALRGETRCGVIRKDVLASRSSRHGNMTIDVRTSVISLGFLSTVVCPAA